MEVVMRLVLMAIVVTSVLAVTSPGDAGAPTRFTDVLDFSFVSSFWTGTCGFPVVQTIQGKVHVELFTAADGSVREIDTLPSLSFELSAPATGRSFSYPMGPTIFEYPQGAYVGAPSIVTTFGLQRRVPGLPAEAGRTVFEGVVLFLNAAGLPVVDFGPPAVEQHGNVNDLFDMIFGACAALAG
jgi:hypothetical protein